MKKTLKPLLFLLSLPIWVFSQPIFEKNIIDHHFINPQDIHVVDLDQDNDLDIISGGYGNNLLTWWENDGDNNFTEHIAATNAGHVKSVYCIDMDNDSDLDIVTCNNVAHDVVWWENDGNQSFTKHIIDNNLNAVYDAHPVDVDGDGHMDVLAGALGADEIVWYKNDGNQDFSKQIVNGNYQNPRKVYADDLNQDGHMDLLSGSVTGHFITWWENDGSENFTEHNLAATLYGATYFFTVDLNGDGHKDILATGDVGAEVAWFENDGNENFTKHTIDDNLAYANYAHAYDVDGDGDIDVLASGILDEVNWYENDGNENFTKHIIDDDLNGANTVWAADLDGDGTTEVVASGYLDHDIVVYTEKPCQLSPICLNSTVSFNGEAEITLSIADVWDEANSLENCSDVFFSSMTPEKVTCDQLGTVVPVSVVVEDSNGNTAQCTANVTIDGLPCNWSAPPTGINCSESSQASFEAATSTFNLTSEGCYDPNYYSTSDANGFTGTQLCGDGEIIAQVTQVTGDGFAGISMRESVAAGAKKLQLMIDGNMMTRRELRAVTGSVAFAHVFQTLGKNWLRLTRVGNQFRAYHSLDGVYWEIVFATNISMNDCIQIGLITMNSTVSGNVVGQFEHVSINSVAPLTAPAGVNMDIQEQLKTADFTFYPNPATDQVTLKLEQFLDQEVTLQVYNAYGQVVRRQHWTSIVNSTEQLNLSDLEIGTYLLEIKTGQQRISKKLVLTKI